MERRIVADRDKCFSAGQCLLVAPELFDQGDDGFVVVLSERVDGKAAQDAAEAARQCPARVITVEEL